MGIVTDIFELVEQCFLEVLQAFLLYGIAGLVVGIILIVLGNKKGLFKRDNILLKILVAFYYVYIPVVIAYTSGAFGAIYTAEEFTKEQVNKKVTPLTKSTFPAYQMFLKFNWNRIIGSKMNFNSTMEEYLAFIEFHPEEDTWWEHQKVKLANEFVPQVAIWSMEAVVHAAKRMEETSESADTDKNKIANALELALHMNIDEHKERFWELVEEETNERIHGFYSKFYWLMGVKFMLLMAVPLLEIIIFIIVRRKRVA